MNSTTSPFKTENPIRVNNIGISNDEYKEFIESSQLLMDFTMRLLNTIVLREEGIHLPLELMVLESQQLYKPGAMFILLKIKLEKEFTIQRYLEMLNRKYGINVNSFGF